MLGAMILGALAASKIRVRPGADGGRTGAGGAEPAQLFTHATWNAGRPRGLWPDAAGRLCTRGFVAMFDKLQQTSQPHQRQRQLAYLRSHPLTTQRIADMQPHSAGCHAAGQRLAGAPDDGRARVAVARVWTPWRQWVKPEPRDASFAARPHAPARGSLVCGRAQPPMQLADPAARQRCVTQGRWRATPPPRQARLLGAELELAAGDAPAALSIWRAAWRWPMPASRMRPGAGPNCCCGPRRCCAPAPPQA